MNVVALIQARLGSTRLPGKVLLDLAGEPLLFHIVERVKRMELLDGFVVATTRAPSDDRIEALCHLQGWPCFRGSEQDVLDRYYQAAKHVHARHIVRITADCPLVCPRETRRLIAHHLSYGADYTHNITVWGSGMPLGAGSEIFRFDSLEASWRDGTEPHHREHVDEYVYEHPERFRIERVSAPPGLHRPELRLTVDTMEDLDLSRRIYRRLWRSGTIVELRDVVRLRDSEPDLFQVNAHVAQKRI